MCSIHEEGDVAGPQPAARTVSRVEFLDACDALWTEMEYQNTLPRRTSEGEATDPPGFATLGRRYLRKLEDAWADNAGNEPALHEMRKVAAIFVRGMIYCGIRDRARSSRRRWH